MKTAEEILKVIESLDNEEKWKLLDKMYDQYYNKGNVPKNEEEVLDY